MSRLVLDALMLGVSLALVFGFGPAFFALVQTSLSCGFKKAAFFSLGVILNDAFMVTACILTNIQVVMSSGNELYFAIGAGIICILFGLFTYYKKVQPTKPKNLDDVGVDKVNSTSPWYTYLCKGFVLNVLNPFVWLFWVGAVAMVSGNLEGEKIKVFSFFLITLGVCFFIDLMKAWGASFLKRFFNEKRLHIMNKILGIALMGFGVYFIGKGLWERLF